MKVEKRLWMNRAEMPIVKKLVDLMQGTIQVESWIGKGESSIEETDFNCRG